MMTYLMAYLLGLLTVPLLFFVAYFVISLVYPLFDARHQLRQHGNISHCNRRITNGRDEPGEK